jgi:hypothetical protein
MSFNAAALQRLHAHSAAVMRLFSHRARQEREFVVQPARGGGGDTLALLIYPTAINGNTITGQPLDDDLMPIPEPQADPVDAIALTYPAGAPLSEYAPLIQPNVPGTRVLVIRVGQRHFAAPFLGTCAPLGGGA